MPSPIEPITLPTPGTGKKTRSKDDFAPTYNVICWNDPVNSWSMSLMSSRKIFGWEKQLAEKHMMEVHEKGQSILIREGAEKAEFYVHELQKYSPARHDGAG